jgi:translation initiation factor IF-3
MINERIRAPEVRVVDEDKNQIGVMKTRDAVDLARERGQDLILVAGNAQPPVCRIMDYGKFKYEESKSKKTNKAKELKSVRLHPRTGEHDRNILIRHSERFLRDGHKVRAVCQFKGRENAYPEIGRAQLEAVAEALKEISTVEGTITKQGRDMTMTLTPRPGIKPLPKQPKNAAEADDEDDKLEEEGSISLDSDEDEIEDGEDSDDEVDDEESDDEVEDEEDEKSSENQA